MRAIPEGSIEIQTGLWLHERTIVIAGTTYISRELYSSEGYCFWSVNQPENYYYDEETGEQGELKPLEERVFAQYAGLSASMGTWTHEQINAVFISVPVQEGFEIVSRPNQEEIM